MRSIYPYFTGEEWVFDTEAIVFKYVYIWPVQAQNDT